MADSSNSLPGQTVTSARADVAVKTEENLNSLLMLLMDEVSKLRIQLEGQKVQNETESVGSNMRDEEDSISTTNSSLESLSKHVFVSDIS